MSRIGKQDLMERCQALRNEITTRWGDSVNLLYWGHRTNKSRRSSKFRLKFLTPDKNGCHCWSQTRPGTLLLSLLLLFLCLFVCLFVCLFACLFVCLFVCLLVRFLVCFLVCLFVWLVGLHSSVFCCGCGRSSRKRRGHFCLRIWKDLALTPKLEEGKTYRHEKQHFVFFKLEFISVGKCTCVFFARYRVLKHVKWFLQQMKWKGNDFENRNGNGI